MVAETEKQHRMLNGEAEYSEAIDAVIEKAEHTLHVFDVDLASGSYDTVSRFEALRHFLAKDRINRLVIILHETERLVRRCPRLMNLLKPYGHAISILKTHEHGRMANDPFVIADEAHYVHRFHADSARALLAFYDHAGARLLEEKFGQLQEASTPAVAATTLGL
ncbi:MAG TPA: hypothetical protein VGK14_06725 [Novimethylophilus sp.]|jgi:hypothetical protein|uniref:DUF7931 domain-containing protein n=1 Tax=Novimethylophilus sp. TaxID=2137426 RepID=UPI002F3F0FDD